MSTTHDSQTGTVFAARDHARGQAGQRAEAMIHVPASASPQIPEGIDPASVVWSETIKSGGYTHKRVARGTTIRLDDIAGDCCAHVIVLNALEPWERLNAADTVKIPWQAYMTTGHPLLSGDGRVMATVTADTSAHHDTFCGYLSDLACDTKYGHHEPFSPTPSGQSLFRLAGTKHNLSRRDLPPSVSFFQGAAVQPDGSFAWTGSAGPGRSVELLAEMPLIVLIANAPHPLDPRADYPTGLLRITAWPGQPTQPGSEQWSRTPELERAYANTADYIEIQGL